MEKSEMVLMLISHYSGGNKAQFAKKLNITPQTINAWISRNTFDAELVFANCEGVSGDWLLSGVGRMLKESESCNKEAQRAIYELTLENIRLKDKITALEGLGHK